MFDSEIELGHLAQFLKVIGHGPDTRPAGILDGEKLITEYLVGKIAITSLAKVTCGLVNILGCPKCAIGNINIQSKSSGRAAHGGVQFAKTNAGVDTTHGLDDIVKRMTLTTLSEEGALDSSILFRRALTNEMVEEV